MLPFIIWKIFHWERDLVEILWEELPTGFRMREIRYNEVHSMVISSHRVRKCVFVARCCGLIFT